MTIVASDANDRQYTGPFALNGVTTVFAFDFQADNAEDVFFEIDGATVDPAEYTVTLNEDGTGEVEFFDAPTAGGVGYILSEPDFDQPSNFQNQGPYLQATIEQSFDREAIKALYLKAQTDRAILMPVGEVGMTIPRDVADRKGMVVGFHSTTGALALLTSELFTGSPGGNVMSTGPFSALATQSVGEADVVRTSGYAASGDGGEGWYGTTINGVAMDATWAADYPLFVVETADGKFLGLLPGPDGFFNFRQAGAEPFATTPSDAELTATNHQPIHAALLLYAEALFGVARIDWMDGDYSWHAPTRTYVPNPLNSEWPQTADDGNGTPINIRVPTVLRCRKVKVWRRAQNGGDPTDITNFQDISADDPHWGRWRGGMFWMIGQDAAPADYMDQAHLWVIGDWTFWGGLPRSPNPVLTGGDGSPDWWDNPYQYFNAAGDGWDGYDQFLHCHANKYTGDIHFYGDIRAGGFRGELFPYQGGSGHGSIYQLGLLELHDTDANGLNPGPVYSENGIKTGTFKAEHIIIREVNQAIEGGLGVEAVIKTLEIIDCVRGGTLNAGEWNDLPDDQTWGRQLRIHSDRVIVERTPNFHSGNHWRIGHLTAIDCGIGVGAVNMDLAGHLIDFYECIADQTDIGNAVELSTDITGSVSVMVTQQNVIGHLHCGRTPYAVANNNFVTNPYTYNDSVGPGCMVGKITGYSINPPNPRGLVGGTGTIPDWHVGFLDTSGLEVTNPLSVTQNVETTPTVVYKGPWLALTSTNAGNHTATLPFMLDKLPPGSRWTLYNESNGTSGWMTIATANTRMTRRLLIPFRRSATFRLGDDGFWYLEGAFSELTASGTIDFAAIAAGAVSPVQTITATGARSGMKVEIEPPDAVASNVEVVRPRVSASDTVEFRLRDLTGAGYDPASGSYAANARYIN